MPAAPTPDRFDVVVVGAGPAGSAAALAALAAGARVALLDRAALPRDKVCGDGLAPHVEDELAALGVHGLVDDYAPVSRLTLAVDGGPSVDGPMERPARVVPRAVLDARLARAAVDAGAVLVRHRVRTSSPGRLDLGGLTAGVVVGADGAQSAVAASLGLRPARAGHVAIALRGYAPVADGAPHRQLIAFPRGRAAGTGWPAYAWSFPVGDGRANVGYGELLPARGPGPSRAQLRERLDRLLPGVSDDGVAWRGHHLPLSTGRPRQPDGAVLLAGDAIGLVNPMTGEGIHAAVVSGALAGRCAARAVAAGRPASAGGAYRAALAARYGRHLRDVGVGARVVRAPALLRAGVRAAARDRHVFDALVDLGLADGRLDLRTVGGVLRAARQARR